MGKPRESRLTGLCFLSGNPSRELYIFAQIVGTSCPPYAKMTAQTGRKKQKTVSSSNSRKLRTTEFPSFRLIWLPEKSVRNSIFVPRHKSSRIHGIMDYYVLYGVEKYGPYESDLLWGWIAALVDTKRKTYNQGRSEPWAKTAHLKRPDSGIIYRNPGTYIFSVYWINYLQFSSIRINCNISYKCCSRKSIRPNIYFLREYDTFNCLS